MKKLLIFVILLTGCDYYNNLIEPKETMEAFQQITLLYTLDDNFGGISTYANDPRYIEADTPPKKKGTNDYFDLFSGYIGSTKKIKILEIEIDVYEVFYENLLTGEYNKRSVSDFSTYIKNYENDGRTILNTITNEPRIDYFSSSSKKVDYGRGLIITDFVMDNRFSNILVSPDAPQNNDPTRIEVAMTIKFNQNY